MANARTPPGRGSRSTSPRSSACRTLRKVHRACVSMSMGSFSCECLIVAASTTVAPGADLPSESSTIAVSPGALSSWIVSGITALSLSRFWTNARPTKCGWVNHTTLGLGIVPRAEVRSTSPSASVRANVVLRSSVASSKPTSKSSTASGATETVAPATGAPVFEMTCE